MKLATAVSASERAAAGPVSPTSEEMAMLTWVERQAVRISEFMNRNRFARAAGLSWLGNVNKRWVRLCTRRITHVYGADVLRDLRQDRGILLCSNHRSFFDQFVLMSYYAHALGRLPPICFPVRSNFFYERWVGIAVNVAMAAGRMYPPIFRDPKKAEFNRYAQARLVELLSRPGNVVGMHPEGRRGKGPDPYTLLPARLGVGQLIMEANPTVLPAFVNGLSNSFVGQVARNLRRHAEPVVVVFGEPLEIQVDDSRRRLRAQKEISERVLEEIRRLGEKERQIRAKLLSA